MQNAEFAARSCSLNTNIVIKYWQNNVPCTCLRYPKHRPYSCMNKTAQGRICVLLEAKQKQWKPSQVEHFTAAPCYHPPPSAELPIRVSIVRKGKGISPTLPQTLIWLTHKRPSDHKSIDPVGPLCLVCLYMCTLSLWGFLTLLPFPFVSPLYLLPPPLPPSSPTHPLLFGVLKHLSTDMFWALEDPGVRDPDRGRK